MSRCTPFVLALIALAAPARAEEPPPSTPAPSSSQPATPPSSSQPAPAPTTSSQPAPAPTTTKPRAPIVNIISQTIDKDGRVQLQLEVVSPSGERFEVRPFVDGKPVKDFTLAQARDVAVADQYTLVVPVGGAGATLSVVVETASGKSAPIELRLRQEGRSFTVETRPLLHVLAVGVGRYGDPDIARLRYPAKDAADLARTLAGQRTLSFRAVESRVLVEEAATRAAVLDAITALGKRATADDTVVVFLAGHGMNDTQGEYYFLPQDARSDPATMLAGADLQAALAAVPSKVVLLLDTCHSGSVLGRRSFARLINGIASESRILVIAASTGDQISRESPAWNNGAFTKALVEGLRGAADYADDDLITASELETFLATRVRDLTGGTQTPTLAKPNAAPDYVVAALPREDALPSPKQTVRRRFLWAGGAIGVALLGTIVAVAVARPWEQPATIDLTFPR